MQKKIIRAKPEYEKIKKPTGRMRILVYKLVNSGYFEASIMTCILLNIFTMAMAYDDSSAEYDKILENVNTFFTSVFILEMVLKIFALRFKGMEKGFISFILRLVNYYIFSLFFFLTHSLLV